MFLAHAARKFVNKLTLPRGAGGGFGCGGDGEPAAASSWIGSIARGSYASDSNPCEEARVGLVAFGRKQAREPGILRKKAKRLARCRVRAPGCLLLRFRASTALASAQQRPPQRCSHRTACGGNNRIHCSMLALDIWQAEHLTCAAASSPQVSRQIGFPREMKGFFVTAFWF